MLFRRSVCLILTGLLLSNLSLASEKIFTAQNDIVVMEVESAPLTGVLAHGRWNMGTDTTGFTGFGYYYSTQDGIRSQNDSTILHYRFMIEKPGNYFMIMRVFYAGEPMDQENDCFTKLDDGPWIKTFCHDRFQWNWAIGHDINHVFTKPPVYKSLDAGEHVFYIAARSKNFRLDRIHFYHEDVEQSRAEDETLPETWKQSESKFKTTSVKPVSFDKIHMNDKFWAPRLETHARLTLETCIAQTRDSTERINNFAKAAGVLEGKHEGIYFDDSDVYKAMEGIAYSLINNPNPEYEALLDEWIELIAGSQQPDGYLNTYYTLNHPDERWTDMEKHEMYCGGHMIEAAVAHYRATGKRTFLDVAIGFADYLDSGFGPGKRHWVPGHEEIELALVKLYHVTGEKKYLDLAHWLLEERGHGHGQGRIWDREHWGPVYCQDDVPVSEISEIKGHAVRAMYLFTGMADVAAVKDMPEYTAALERVWKDVVYRNMYITGGIGSSGSNEGFSKDYDLPNKTAYCETCASIGMVLWNSRMNLFSQDAKYVDVMERSLYNGVLAGWSLDGDLFFYVNPLESDGDHHRRRWYGCACCPSNVARFIPSLGSYIYLAGEKDIFVNLYAGSETKVYLENTEVKLIQKTRYPWDGEVDIEVNPANPAEFSLHLRIPGWCKGFDLHVNGKPIETLSLKKGYIRLKRTWKPGDRVQLNMKMPVEVVAADPRVTENNGKRAIQRGPLVYCIEAIDNPSIDLDAMVLRSSTQFEIRQAKGKLEGMTQIEGSYNGNKLTFIPYFAWDNREAGKMKVWVDYRDSESAVTVFRSGTEGYDTFRIPALITASDGTLLAFAEGRKNSGSDAGDIDLVLKRSSDNGNTWSKLQVVWDDANNTCGNPAPVLDRSSGRIYLPCTRNLGTDSESEIIDQKSDDTRRVYMMHSDDAGKTWSRSREITKDVKLKDWTWYATGPGSGIQVERGQYKGRLVIPCDHIEAGTKHYYSHSIYSDDSGETWILGGRTPEHQVNECQVVELADGRLLLNMRNYDRSKHTRQIAFSGDGGKTWTGQSLDSTLIEPICQAAIYRSSWPEKGKPGVIVFSNPASRTERVRMTIRASFDDGMSWPFKEMLYSGPSAYSDLAVLPDGRIACLYERGEKHPYETIVLHRIDLELN